MCGFISLLSSSLYSWWTTKKKILAMLSASNFHKWYILPFILYIYIFIMHDVIVNASVICLIFRLSCQNDVCQLSFTHYFRYINFSSDCWVYRIIEDMCFICIVTRQEQTLVSVFFFQSVSGQWGPWLMWIYITTST